uniref:Uncharacterized protein n=1 Tax=Arundo donax TaxID=35708 RepID=A0A0A9CCW8_ARUDO
MERQEILDCLVEEWQGGDVSSADQVD